MKVISPGSFRRLRLLDMCDVVDQKGTKPLARSSHSISFIQGKAYIFGGEHLPRTPIDNTLHCFDFEKGIWITVDAKGTAPAPRVGHTATSIGSALFVFGGRTAKEVGEGSLNDLHRFDCTTSTWTVLAGAYSRPPAIRSFHSMVSDGERYLYVFGGCGENGRLNDLHCYDTKTDEWEQLPACEQVKARGGAGFAITADKNALHVVGGFCGVELGDHFRYNIGDRSWGCLSDTGAHGLPPRSVFGIASLGASSSGPAKSQEGMILYGGEVDPSSGGHDFAGHFSTETFLFPDKPGGHGWRRAETSGTQQEPRGWFASCPADGKLLVHGGNSNSNERLDDLFFIRL